MKKFSLIILLLYTVNTFGQENEIKLAVNTGGSFFIGNGASSGSTIISDSYTNSPLGKHPAWSFGIGLNYKHIFQNNFFLGGGLGYENLRTKVNLTENYVSSEKIGDTFLNNKAVYIDPFVGYRFHLKNRFSIDVLGGIDLPYIFKQTEKAEYKNENRETKRLKNDRDYINFDCRLRLQTNFNYKNFSFFISYHHGLRNYESGYIAEIVPQSYMNAFKIGLQY